MDEDFDELIPVFENHDPEPAVIDEIELAVMYGDLPIYHGGLHAMRDHQPMLVDTTKHGKKIVCGW
jgi:hypothetical protein